MDPNKTLELLNNISECCLILDLSGRVIDFNSPALTYVNSKSRMLKNKHIVDLLLLQPALSPDNWLFDLKQIRGEISFKFGELKTVAELRVAELDEKIFLFIRDRSVEKDLHDGFKIKLKQLDEINKNLENLVIDRTKKILVQKNLLDEIYNNIIEVVILCDLRGNCLPDQPPKTNTFFLAEDIAGRNISELLFENSESKSQFKSWLELVESESLPFVDLIPLVESTTSLNSRTLNLSYRLLESSPKTIVVILNDRTEHLNLSRDLQKSSEENLLYLSLLRSPEKMQNKFIEWENYLQNLVRDGGLDDQKNAAGILHLLKGSFLLESFYDAYMAVQRLEEARSAITQSDIIFLLKLVQTNKDLMAPKDHSQGRVLMLSHLVSKCKKILEKSSHPFTLNILNDVTIPDSISSSLEYIIIQHFRNILAHGFESTEDRARLNKPPHNLIEIDARPRQETTEIVISDDGKGLSKDPKGSHVISLLSGTGEGLNGIHIEAKRINGTASLVEINNKVSLILSYPNCPS